MTNENLIEWLEKQTLIQQCRTAIVNTVARIDEYQRSAQAYFDRADLLYQSPADRLHSWKVRATAWSFVEQANDQHKSLARAERKLNTLVDWYIGTL